MQPAAGQARQTLRAQTLRLPADFDLTALNAWKTPANWKKRRTDELAVAQPPLKHQYQVLFNMTLVGACVLEALRQKYRIEPWVEGANGSLIEMYPGGTMRKLGLAAYKAVPGWSVALARDFLDENGVTIELDDETCTFAFTYNTGGGTPDFDGADALIALMMAIAHREGLTARAFDGTDADYELEGAIWLPP